MLSESDDPRANDPAAQEAPWQACSPGELSHMVRRLNAARQTANRKRLMGRTAVSAALFAGLVLLAGSLLGTDGPLFGGIRCADCRQQFAAYHDHLRETTRIADAKLVASMKTHLEQCEICRGKFEKTYPGILRDDLSAAEQLDIMAAARRASRPQFRLGMLSLGRPRGS